MNEAPSESKIDREEFARVMRQNRVLLGYTIREAAEQAGISKTTVVRLESGLPILKSSLHKLCRVYGCVPISPWLHEPADRQGKHFRMQGKESMQWYATRLDDKGKPEVFSSSDAQDPQERRRLGTLGLATHFGLPLRCRRESSRMIPFLTEVYGRTEASSHQSGEWFIYCLRGSVRVEVGDESFILMEGEVAIYDATQMNSLSPAHSRREPSSLALQILLP